MANQTLIKVNLNELQEIVDFIELNRTTLETLTIASVAGLQTALNSKVDKVTGKQLSENDFTNALISKLNAIEAEAEVNVQANYTMNDSTDDSYIQAQAGFQNIKNQFKNISSNLDQFKASKTEFLKDYDSKTISEGADTDKLKLLYSSDNHNYSSKWSIKI